MLERRKRERAVLAAYIHSSGQASVKCVTTTGIAQRNNQKRLDWNSCLLRDQELILKLRENVKTVGQDYRSAGKCSNSDRSLEKLYPSPTPFRHPSLPKEVLVTSTRSVERNYALTIDDGYSDQNVKAPSIFADAVPPNPSLEMDTYRAYQLVQLPGTGPVTCEMFINTSATRAP
jgi:hypothetical protein